MEGCQFPRTLSVPRILGFLTLRFYIFNILGISESMASAVSGLFPQRSPALLHSFQTQGRKPQLSGKLTSVQPPILMIPSLPWQGVGVGVSRTRGGGDGRWGWAGLRGRRQQGRGSRWEAGDLKFHDPKVGVSPVEV